MAGKILKVAVMGQGRSGFGIHVKWLREAQDQFKVVAFADLLPERHEATAELGAKGYGDYQELLGDKSLDLDLVVNALPSHLHAAGTIAALNSGRNVLSEKPFALSLADFDAMTAAAKKNDRKLFAFQNSRFQPVFAKLMEVLNSGKLGKLVHARIQYSNFARRWDWQTTQSYHGGNINNTGPHPLDQAIMLFGERGGTAPQVFSRLGCENQFGDADDFAAVSIYGPGAPLIEVVVSSFQAYSAGETYNLACTQGGLTGGGDSLKWKYFDLAASPSHEHMTGWSDKRSYNNEDLTWIEESWTQTRTMDTFKMLSRALYNNLYDVLVNGASATITLEQVRRQIGVLEQVHLQNPLPRKYK